MRFLHTSDWQLGMTRHYLAGEAQARFSEARLDAISRLADVVRDRDCAFVVVAGDVFETNQPDARTVARALDRLRELSVPVYLLPGNHDPFDPASVYRSAAFVDGCPPHVEVLGDTTPRRPVDGVEVVGAPWTSKRPLSDLVGERCMEAAAGDVRRVVVGHGAVAEVRGSFDDPAQIELARVESAIDAGCVHYVALGDRHSCTSVGRTGRIWYSGAPEPTSYREVDAGTALVVDLDVPDGGPAAVERVQVGTWRYHDLAHAVDGDEDLDALEAVLDGVPDPSRAIVRVRLEGTLDLRQVARLETLLEDRRLRFGALEQPERHRDVAVLPSDGDLSSLSLTGYAAVAGDRLRERAGLTPDAAATMTIRSDGERVGTGPFGGDDLPDAGVAADALALLLRLATGARAA